MRVAGALPHLGRLHFNRGLLMTRLASSACAFVLLGVATTGTAATASYFQLTDLGDLANDRLRSATFVSGLNERSEAVGQSFDKQLRARAYLWRGGKLTDLGDSLGILTELEAFAINKRSQIV